MADILDHGSTFLIDHMASDLKVCGAARVSTGSIPAAASKGRDKDDALIHYLMTNGHGSPFEHAVFQWFIKAPLFVVREWQRHRMASYNEFSMRYAEVEPEAQFYIPDHVRKQDPVNRQGAVIAEHEDYRREVADPMLDHNRASYGLYLAMRERGVAREMARMVLPVSFYTRFWFTVNARSLMNFLALRNHPNAMWEIQQYAAALEKDFAILMPLTHEAFVQNGRVAP